MQKKQYFISLIENSEFSDEDKIELIRYINKSEGDNFDVVIKNIIQKLINAKQLIDLFYENPQDFYQDVGWLTDLVDKLQNL